MTARFINLDTGTVETVSSREFYTRLFGHPPRTREQVKAEWDAKVERYVELILRGCDMDSYGNPAVREAKELIASRAEQFTVCAGDPLLPKNRRAA